MIVQLLLKQDVGAVCRCEASLIQLMSCSFDQLLQDEVTSAGSSGRDSFPLSELRASL